MKTIYFDSNGKVNKLATIINNYPGLIVPFMILLVLLLGLVGC